MPEVKLKIADIIIRLKSNFPQEKLFAEELQYLHPERFESFFYRGSNPGDIRINIHLVKSLPKFSGKDLFITTHFQDGFENWRLLKVKKGYVYKSPLKEKKQLMWVNREFNRVEAYLLPRVAGYVFSKKKEEFLKENKGLVWKAEDIVYDFLQVLLINYFSFHRLGIFTHSVGIKDSNGQGLLFSGKSGAGKSTTARIWHKYSRAKVLNDDRVIIRKKNGRFFIYGSPWHGDFSDYLASRIDSAPLEKISFIYHARENKLKLLSQKEAFFLLFPALFPPFWDKFCLSNAVSFSLDLLKEVPAYRLGFVNNSRVISFIRKSL